MNAIFWNDCPELLPYRYIGPYKVSHYLRQNGFTTQVIDFVTNYSEEELYTLTNKFITSDTLMLGVSMTFIGETSKRKQISPVLVAVLKRIKQENTNIKIIAGGYNADVIDSFDVIDASVSSYGEDIVLELLNHYRNGAAPPLSVIQMPLRGNKVRTNYYQSKNTQYNIETDNFMFTKQDAIVPGETLPLEISRGCIFKCKFCNHRNLGRGKLDYLRSFDCIKQELVYNYENFNTTSYYVICDTFNDTEYKMTEWYKMVSSLPFKINYSAYLRADLIHRFPDMAYQLKETGLFGAFHGLESLHPDASNAVGKGWSGRHARDFIPELYHNMWEGKIPQTLSFIVGLPGDTIPSIASTVDWFIENKLHSIKFETLGLRKTQIRNPSEFERDAAKYGYTFDDNGNWQLDYINQSVANRYTKLFNTCIMSYDKTNSWRTLGMIGTLGIEKSALLENKTIDFPRVMIQEKRKIFLDKYKNILLSL